METLIGMALIVFGIGGVVLILGGVIGVFTVLPGLVRVALVLRARPVPTAEVRDGRVAVQGLVDCDGPLPSFTDGSPLVWRRLTVVEQVGNHNHTRHVSTSSVEFALDDGKGRMPIDPAHATVMSPGGLGGPLNDAVAAFVGPVFAWPKTPKHFFEETVAPGDFVTIVGDALDGTFMGAPWIVRGEPKLTATEEFRTLCVALLVIPGGAALSAGCWVLLQVVL